MVYLLMAVTDEKPYSELEKELNQSRKLKANLMVISLPGLGLNHYLKKYVEKYHKSGVGFITHDGDKLNLYNIIVWSRDWGENALAVFDKYLHQATSNQKFTIATTRPWLLEKEAYHQSYLSDHVYHTAYLDTLSDSDVVAIVEQKQLILTKLQIQKLIDLSGGIPQIVKFLIVNPKYIDAQIGNILVNENLKEIIDTISVAVSQCRPDTLLKLGIIDNQEKVKSALLASKILRLPNTNFDLQITFDLNIIEQGIILKSKATIQEKAILEKMLSNCGHITKEEVSDIKWGEGKYDQFSDQAVNKTMRRLDQKLRKYRIITIPKTGFILQEEKLK